MAIVRPDYEQLVERAQNLISTLTPINQFHESSVAGALVRVVAALLTQLYDVLESLEEDLNLTTARGQALDRIGSMFGVTRRPATRASTLTTSAPIKFTNNGTTAVSIPAGTKVWSSRRIGITYSTTESIDVPAGAEGYVHVIADGEGRVYEAGVGEIDRHSLGSSSVTVTNIAPIGNALDVESDDSYRQRIAQAFMRRYYGSEIAIRGALLDLPGVRDVQLLPLRRGPGTLDVYVVPTEAQVDSTFVGLLREVLANEVVPGIDWQLLLPEILPLDVTLRLVVSAGWSSDMEAAIRSAVMGYVHNLGIGEPLYRSELLSRVMDVSSLIRDADLELYVDGVPAGGSFTPGSFQSLRVRRVEVQLV